MPNLVNNTFLDRNKKLEQLLISKSNRKQYLTLTNLPNKLKYKSVLFKMVIIKLIIQNKRSFYNNILTKGFVLSTMNEFRHI